MKTEVLLGPHGDELLLELLAAHVVHVQHHGELTKIGLQHLLQDYGSRSLKFIDLNP